MGGGQLSIRPEQFRDKPEICQEQGDLNCGYNSYIFEIKHLKI